ncbi:MAG: permease [Firmicutes bacterium]|jgi:uncharacterized membrane protein YraQ (UPF0718 family)|nr:permease [Bacillota bacterium]
MNKVLALLKRYALFFVLLIVYAGLFVKTPEIGQTAMGITLKNVKEMLIVVPPIFLLLGLLDIWVERDTMMKYMGENSGIIGVVLAFLLGSMAAGPLYGSFPLAAMLLKKGSKFSNVYILLGAWSTTKIPLIMFEASSMGLEFMLVRLALNLVGIVAIALIIDKVLSKEEKAEIIEKAADL